MSVNTTDPSPADMHLIAEAFLETRRAARLHGLDVHGSDDEIVTIMDTMRQWMSEQQRAEADERGRKRALLTAADRPSKDETVHMLDQARRLFVQIANRLGSPCPNQHPPTRKRYCPICHKRVDHTPNRSGT